MTIEESAWLRRFGPKSEAMARLVCLPHAGGSATFYLPVSRQLSPDIDVVAIQYPGRQDRRSEPGIADIDELADRVYQEIRPLTEQPLYLFGHSMGAVIGFEVARRLEADGIALAALFVSGRRAPSCHRDERAHLLDDAGLVDEIRKLAGTEGALLDDPELTYMILPAIRNDYRAVENYRWRPGPKLNCPVFAFIGDSDPKSTTDEASAWREHTSGPFELHVFPGGHFYLNDCAPKLIDMIRKRIPDSEYRV